MGSALNASFGRHFLVLKNEAKRDPSTSSGKAFIGPRSAGLCGTSMFDSNLPLTERHEELLISIRDAAEAIFQTRFLNKKFIWEDKEIGSMSDNLQAAKVLYRQNPTAENRMA